MVASKRGIAAEYAIPNSNHIPDGTRSHVDADKQAASRAGHGKTNAFQQIF
jgi:hypothetical protein